MSKSSTLFKKGQIPWNKGKPFLAGSKNPMYGKHHSEATKKEISKSNTGNSPNASSFKKGHTLSQGEKNANYGKVGKLNPFYGKKHTKKTKKRLSRLASNRILEKNPNWQGGVSFEPYGIEFNDKLREEIKRKDGFTCQLCGDKLLYARRIKINPSKNWLVVHHIDYDKQNNNPENLIALCNFCNISVNRNRENWTKHFQKMMKGGQDELNRKTKVFCK